MTKELSIKVESGMEELIQICSTLRRKRFKISNLKFINNYNDFSIVKITIASECKNKLKTAVNYLNKILGIIDIYVEDEENDINIKKVNTNHSDKLVRYIH